MLDLREYITLGLKYHWHFCIHYSHIYSSGCKSCRSKNEGEVHQDFHLVTKPLRRRRYIEYKTWPLIHGETFANCTKAFLKVAQTSNYEKLYISHFLQCAVDYFHPFLITVKTAKTPQKFHEGSGSTPITIYLFHAQEKGKIIHYGVA